MEWWWFFISGKVRDLIWSSASDCYNLLATEQEKSQYTHNNHQLNFSLLHEHTKYSPSSIHKFNYNSSSSWEKLDKNYTLKTEIEYKMMLKMLNPFGSLPVSNIALDQYMIELLLAIWKLLCYTKCNLSSPLW